MSSHNIKCFLGFPTTHNNPHTARLESRCSTMDSSYGEGYGAWRGGLSTVHDAVDAALAGNAAAAAEHVAAGKQQLAACSGALTAFGQALVNLRSDLFERGAVDSSEPLLAREPFFATLDYDAIHRELAGQGAVLLSPRPPGESPWRGVGADGALAGAEREPAGASGARRTSRAARRWRRAPRGSLRR